MQTYGTQMKMSNKQERKCHIREREREWHDMEHYKRDPHPIVTWHKCRANILSWVGLCFRLFFPLKYSCFSIS